MKGSYILVIFISGINEITIGSLGNIIFDKGFYLYIGSAMGSYGSSTLENRVNRHISASKFKKTHWHIDYLLNSKRSSITQIYLIPSFVPLECIIAKEIKVLSDGKIENFGSSDCSCSSHLFYFQNFKEFRY
jgi:Uri superfamily endonuclease